MKLKQILMGIERYQLLLQSQEKQLFHIVLFLPKKHPLHSYSATVPIIATKHANEYLDPSIKKDEQKKDRYVEQSKVIHIIKKAAQIIRKSIQNEQIRPGYKFVLYTMQYKICMPIDVISIITDNGKVKRMELKIITIIPEKSLYASKKRNQDSGFIITNQNGTITKYYQN